jgi:hypothetical protein
MLVAVMRLGNAYMEWLYSPRWGVITCFLTTSAGQVAGATTVVTILGVEQTVEGEKDAGRHVT